MGEEMTPITTINVELCSACNKSCWCCGRRKREKENPDIIKTYGNMPIDMVKDIARQLPDGIFVHLHWNGEPLLYPQFGWAVEAFENKYTHITTNGKLILKKLDEVRLLDTMAISVIENDPEADAQYEMLKQYCHILNEGLMPLPHTVLRLNGNVDDKRYRELLVPIAKRILHDPMGSFKYTAPPTLPETGVCQDMLHHPAIDRHGNINICVRYDPKGLGAIGHVSQGIMNVLDGKTRREYISLHIQGRRNEVPLCASCQYWGVPTSR